MDMSSMIDHMVQKRLGCACVSNDGAYKHVACIFKKHGKQYRILALGHNRFILSEKLPNIHAEMAAIAKLHSHRRKKLESVQMCVLRVNGNGKLNNSKPCNHCVLSLNMITPMKGYRIENVFYSNETGGISKARFSDLDTDGHDTRFFRERNFKIR